MTSPIAQQIAIAAFPAPAPVVYPIIYAPPPIIVPAPGPVVVSNNPGFQGYSSSSDAVAVLAIAGALSLGFFALTQDRGRQTRPPAYLRIPISPQNLNVLRNRGGIRGSPISQSKKVRSSNTWLDYDNVHFSELPRNHISESAVFFPPSIPKPRNKNLFNYAINKFRRSKLANFIALPIKALKYRKRAEPSEHLRRYKLKKISERSPVQRIPGRKARRLKQLDHAIDCEEETYWENTRLMRMVEEQDSTGCAKKMVCEAAMELHSHTLSPAHRQLLHFVGLPEVSAGTGTPEEDASNRDPMQNYRIARGIGNSQSSCSNHFPRCPVNNVIGTVDAILSDVSKFSEIHDALLPSASEFSKTQEVT